MCSLRLDFLSFNIQAGDFAMAAGGTMDSLGACRDTFAVITNTNGANTPVICGQNEGQHSKLLTIKQYSSIPKVSDQKLLIFQSIYQQFAAL